MQFQIGTERHNVYHNKYYCINMICFYSILSLAICFVSSLFPGWSKLLNILNSVAADCLQRSRHNIAHGTTNIQVIRIYASYKTELL